MDEFISRLLDSRERRYDYQKKLINKYKKPIISFMLNIPGKIKRTDKYVEFHKMGIKLIEDTLGKKLLISEYYDEDTGMYYLASVDLNGEELKRKMIALEDSPQGRLFDIDVFDENHRQITRKSLNLEPRKCLLCSNYARICIKEQIHSYNDLVNKTEEIVNIFVKTNNRTLK